MLTDYNVPSSEESEGESLASNEEELELNWMTADEIEKANEEAAFAEIEEVVAGWKRQADQKREQELRLQAMAKVEAGEFELEPEGGALAEEEDEAERLTRELAGRPGSRTPPPHEPAGHP
eukprot:SAG25_NODE_2519_length_1555_cov_2.331731_2_plen_121_part_00